ncbi:Phthalate 4,5-dioxygenase [Pseudonocardia dioxanivorans CB1190]|uniref:Phthalate 4,5-dioxygenase n=1 Tax=Pseudonocardia dioxanivorans (strain ATCC 55486 / DSM 44775 / JCM 13855 / CB1190) TaxID=675635 RepID=F4CN75_PSEUX|nr:Rieske 2Fe-2S domain-containing protein [Pseudonocardia dioxanivorans]AEA26088.1 Phthalate 4,5-dioxygenase [Pseudonocardia dioxanivorans CB1190]
MLSAEDNEILTRVGPGTPMGELLRRYWMPAALSEELPSAGGDPVRVRLLGEDLVAFRDLNGRIGLIQENCPHRGASLWFGRNEGSSAAPSAAADGACGLRCPYHGWQFDVDGRCIDMPSEPASSSFKERVQARAYPVHESGGVVWAYLGPRETMTPFRDFGTDSLAPEHVMAGKTFSPCNWVQAMEGNLDTSHISWLHQYDAISELPDDGTDKPGYNSVETSWRIWRHDRAPRLEVHDDWYGYRYAGIRTSPNGHTHVRITGFCVPNVTTVAAIPYRGRLSMFVPVDDENCLRYNLVAQKIGDMHGYGSGGNLFDVRNFPYAPQTRQGIRPRQWTAENDYLIDREAQRTQNFTGISDFNSQDLMATESMGPIYDRSQEHLGTSDRAVIRMRRILIGAAKALAENGTPPPALAEDGHDFRTFRSAEKILEPGEDWRILGTDDDPLVREELLARRSTASGQA